MILLLDTTPCVLKKKKELLVVEAHGKSPTEVPLKDLEGVIVFDRAKVTYDAMITCGEWGVPVVYVKRDRPVMMCHPFAAHGLVQTRRAQILSYEDARGVHLGMKFVGAAIENKARLLLYFAKGMKESNSTLAGELREAAGEIREVRRDMIAFLAEARPPNIDAIRLKLIGYEGTGARLYFEQFAKLVPAQFQFYGRQRRPPPDPVNALLSLTYTVLQGVIGISVAASGLELYAGYVHSDRSGKPSLLLDLIEEFRQPFADRLVLRLLHLNQIRVEDFSDEEQGYPRLAEDARGKFYNAFFQALREGGTSLSGRGVPFQQLVVAQGRALARYLTGREPKYKPFLMKW